MIEAKQICPRVALVLPNAAQFLRPLGLRQFRNPLDRPHEVSGKTAKAIERDSL